MRYIRWRLRTLLITVACLAMLPAGAAKWRRYSELHEQIESYSQDESQLLAAYDRVKDPPGPCGNPHRLSRALVNLAMTRKNQRKDCERQIRRLWFW